MARFDSAMRIEIPISLIFFTASMKRVTTTGARPSKGSSSSSTAGDSAIARAMATIFFSPPLRNSPRRCVNFSTSGKTARMRFCVSCSETWSVRPPASAIQRQTWKFSETVRSVNSPASSGA